MKPTAALAAFLVAASAAVAGCAGRHSADTRQGPATAPASRREPELVASPRSLLAACHSTARAVGYPVPCPERIPAGLTETGASGTTCTLHVIGPGGVGGCAKSWRGWVVGSSVTSDQHLVVTASPRPLRNCAKVVNGPAWHAGERVRRLARLTIHGWDVQAVYVPAATNEGSAFMHHVVLIWTVGNHTYGVGFHDVRGVRQTLALDEKLVASIRLVAP